MSDNYVSPYGFGPLTDAVLDNIAENAGWTPNQLGIAIDRLPEDVTEEFRARVDHDWWKSHMSYARDGLSDLLSEYIDLEAT